jgi:hypothetical protein
MVEVLGGGRTSAGGLAFLFEAHACVLFAREFLSMVFQTHENRS